MALKIGSKAPDFKLQGTSDKEVHFYKDVNQICVLYFYPKDFTPGCTKEACDFRDDFSFFKDLNIPVFGISTDSIPTHKKFKEQYNLPFELLSDPKGKVIESYKAKFPFINMTKRVTYLIDADKKILAAFDNLLNAPAHINQMKKALEKAAVK